MSQEHEEADNRTPQHSHRHACANLFGCADEKGVGIFREDIKEGAFDSRASDRLLHMDEVDQEKLDAYLSLRGRLRRNFLQASSLLGVLTAVGPWFAKLARADEPVAASKPASHDGGRVHVAFPTLGHISSMNCSRACRSIPW